MKLCQCRIVDARLALAMLDRMPTELEELQAAIKALEAQRLYSAMVYFVRTARRRSHSTSDNAGGLPVVHDESRQGQDQRGRGRLRSGRCPGCHFDACRDAEFLGPAVSTEPLRRSPTATCEAM